MVSVSRLSSRLLGRAVGLLGISPVIAHTCREPVCCEACRDLTRVRHGGPSLQCSCVGWRAWEARRSAALWRRTHIGPPALFLRLRRSFSCARRSSCPKNLLPFWSEPTRLNFVGPCVNFSRLPCTVMSRQKLTPTNGMFRRVLLWRGAHCLRVRTEEVEDDR